MAYTVHDFYVVVGAVTWATLYSIYYVNTKNEFNVTQTRVTFAVRRFGLDGYNTTTSRAKRTHTHAYIGAVVRQRTAKFNGRKETTLSATCHSALTYITFEKPEVDLVSRSHLFLSVSLAIYIYIYIIKEPRVYFRPVGSRAKNVEGKKSERPYCRL